MRVRKYINFSLLVLISLVIASIAIAGGLVPNLPNGWSQVSPDPKFTYHGLSPACSSCPATDPTYKFFVRKGTVNKVLIYFNGGGACWDSMNCLYALTYNPMVFEYVSSGQLYVYNQPDPTSPGTVNQGIFDFTNANNPFKDWYVVYLPYCTGDLFWGAKDFPYPTGPTSTWTIQHRGFVDFQAVLKWVKDNFKFPLQIFVTGSSAGGYGAIMDYPFIREAFPLTRVYVLGDAANGITGDDFNSKAAAVWNPQFATWILGNDITQLTIEDIYSNIAAEYPLMKLGQYTAAYDQTQTWFYHLQLDNNVENPAVWNSLTQTDFFWWNYYMNQYAWGTAASSPNYRYYIAKGGVHTILGRPEFYTESSAGGVYFSQWLTSMVNNPFGFGGGPLQGIWQNLENNNP
jgi:hypothetical protein